jgi:hypothetical protein
MKLEFRQSYTITPVWAMVRQIRQHVTDLVQTPYPALAPAAAVAASELFENAVKYGQGVVDFNCVIEGGELRIEVANDAANPADLRVLTEHIERIRQGDPFELYTQRLMMLMENTQGGSAQIGLYRVACESGCRLEHHIDGLRVVVIARRTVTEAPSRSRSPGDRHA